jgi:hypothetical protein
MRKAALFYLIGMILLVFFAISRQVRAADNQQCQWVPVDQNSFAEILTMINSRIEENYNRIKTWQGKVNATYESVDEGKKKSYEQILVDKPLPSKITDRVELIREFAVDVNKGLLYESVDPNAQQKITDGQGKNLQLNELVQISSGKTILTPNYQIDCRDIKNHGVVVHRNAIKQSRPPGRITCQSNMRPVFDPRETMRIFGDIRGESSAPLGGTFAKYLASFNKEGGRSIDGYPTITVEECNVGKVKKYRITLLILAKDDSGSTVHTSSALICSSETGFNVDSFSTTYNNGKMLENKTWDYGLIDGVYLPKQKTERKFDYHTGDLINNNTINFIDQSVNRPISEETFTYKNLDLKDGGKFIDKIEKKEYKYKDANLVFVKDINN